MIVRLVLVLFCAVALRAQQPAANPKPAAPASPPVAAGQAVPQPQPAKPAPATAAPPATAPAQQAPAAPPATTADAGFVLNLQSASLHQVIDILARRLHINYILDPRVKGTVTINTYGEIKQVSTRALLETVLRINGASMVQVGDIFRIVPVGDVSRLPIPPQNEPKSLPDDERVILNLVFLKYATVSELSKLIEPFLGEGGKLVSYEPANLMLILDNSRNMKRTMDLIAVFDNDNLAHQRVRLFEVKNGRPSDLAKELETVMKAVSLAGEKGSASVRFLAIDRINTIVAIAPNPGVFAQVEDWLKRLDIEPKTTAGTVDNYVYRVKYSWAEMLAMSIMQLYMGYGYGGGMGMSGMGMGGYGMMGMGGYGTAGIAGGYGSGMSSFGGMGTRSGGMGGMGMGGMGYGGGMGGMGYGGMGGGYGGGYGGMGGGYGGGYGGMGGGYGAASPLGVGANPGQTTAGAAGTTAITGDLTGNYLAGGGFGMIPASIVPRVIPNPMDNTLLIQATPQDYQQLVKLLSQLDVPPRQVLVEAKIYEVNMQGSFSSGVQAYLNSLGQALPTGITGRQLVGSSTSAGATLTAGLLVGSSRQLLAVLTASEQNKKAKLVSAPTIIATDSIAARMNVGDAVPTLTGQAVGNVQSAGSSLFTQSIQNVQTGVTLDVVARVTPAGIITMKIDQQVSAPVAPDASSSIQTPSFSNRSVSTQVTVQDGDTVAIGGIMLDTDTSTSSGIPILHRIPGIGAAFSTKSISKTRTELVIFFTPHVIYDTNGIADATEEIKSSFKKLRPVIQE